MINYLLTIITHTTQFSRLTFLWQLSKVRILSNATIQTPIKKGFLRHFTPQEIAYHLNSQNLVKRLDIKNTISLGFQNNFFFLKKILDNLIVGKWEIWTLDVQEMPIKLQLTWLQNSLKQSINPPTHCNIRM